MKEKGRSFLHIYGPVPSRRLGFSLGVDILPFKTCSFDCIYCQLGRSSRKTTQQRKYFSSKRVLSQIKKILDSGVALDHITFSGSGEPTLNKSIGTLIREIKRMTAVPVAVLTNSSLLTQKKVRTALLAADVVVPSLDAATQKSFVRINRPHPSIRVEEIIDSLVKFRREFKGEIWLEIMLVKNVNDSPADLKVLKEAISRIKPDRVQLNTVVRPPAESWAKPLTAADLEKIRRKIGGNCEMTIEFPKKSQLASQKDPEATILSIIERRPVTLEEMAVSQGHNKEEIEKLFTRLCKKGKIRALAHRRKVYYESVHKKD